MMETTCTERRGCALHQDRPNTAVCTVGFQGCTLRVHHACTPVDNELHHGLVMTQPH